MVTPAFSLQNPKKHRAEDNKVHLIVWNNSENELTYFREFSVREPCKNARF